LGTTTETVSDEPPNFVIVKEVDIAGSFNRVFFDDRIEFFNNVAEGATVFVDDDNCLYAFGEGIVYILVEGAV
jgi:hypothetical protein